MLTWTPLHLAVQRGSRALPVIAELLRLKADPNTTDAIGLPVLGVSQHPAIVELLVQHNANVNLQTGMTKVSLGLSAAKVPPASVVRKLLELRADVNGNETHRRVGHSPLSNLTWSSPTLQRKAVKLAAVPVSCQCKSGRQCTGAFRRFFPLPGSSISGQALLG